MQGNNSNWEKLLIMTFNKRLRIRYGKESLLIYKEYYKNQENAVSTIK